MIAIRFSRFVVGAIAVAMLLACKPTGQAEVERRMARRIAELDRLSGQAGTAGLPPVRILFPVGGHDGDPPAGTRRPFSALGRYLEGRIRIARPGHKARPSAAWQRSGHPDQDGGAGVGGTAEGDVASAIPFWDERDLPPGIFLTGLFSFGESSEARPQNPTDANGPHLPLPSQPDPPD